MFITAEKNKGNPLPWMDSPITVESTQFDWAFAVNVLFRLFGDRRFSGFDLESSSYPPLPLRRRLAMDFGFKVLMENWGAEHEDKITASVLGSVKIVEDSFSEIGATPAEGGFAAAYSDESAEHIKKLGEWWEKLRPDLALYSYESLEPTPVQQIGHTRITLTVRTGSDKVKRGEVLHNWHKSLLHEAIPPIIDKWEPRLGVSVNGYFLQRMKTKWGSCNHRAGNIRLNTELVKKPKDLLEYVIVHEMAHLQEPTHNERFAAILDKHYPTQREARIELNDLPLAVEAWGE